MSVQKVLYVWAGGRNGQLEWAEWVELKLGTLSHEISTVDNL